MQWDFELFQMVLLRLSNYENRHDYCVFICSERWTDKLNIDVIPIHHCMYVDDNYEQELKLIASLRDVITHKSIILIRGGHIEIQGVSK
jgi:hypothetical protein